MPTPRLLTSDDWPEAELRAAVLAGELVPVGSCWASVAEAQVPSLRAEAWAVDVPDRRLVACGGSAAWIWGGRSCAPEPAEAAASLGIRIADVTTVRVRQVRIGPEDTVALDGVRVTTPVRTVVDLLRAIGDLDPDAADAVRGLFAVGATEPEAVLAALDALGTVPMVRQAARRLDALLDAPLGG